MVAALKARGWYKTPLGSGKHDITCPWVGEHTDSLDTGAVYFEPNDTYSVGGFCCQHSHGDKCHIRSFLEVLGVRRAEARHKPLIRLVPGDVDSIATFRGGWSDYCRHPLIWLGHSDPVTALLEQVRHDPDGDALGCLMTEWRAVFESRPTTVRKAVDTANAAESNLLDAMHELAIEERGKINNSKLGWFLKKNANRIVKGFEFQQAESDGRKAWRVVAVKTPPLPALPPLAPAVEETVTG